VGAGAGAAPAPGGWRRRLRAPLAAVMFLTRVPVPRWVGHDDGLLARATPYFPLVGLVVGAGGGAVFWAASLGWPAAVGAACATGATVWLTGAFHEDALADSADGFGGGWGREQVLAIMQDSRVGSYGAVAVALAVAARVAALAGIGAADGAGAGVRALVAAHVLARWSSLPLIWGYPYVRAGESKGRPFAAAVTTARLLGGTALALAVVVPVLGLPALGGSAARTAACLAAAVAVTALAGRYFRRRLGGITGDCLGAANQFVELAVYLVLAFRWRGIS
jgi:adenosylcobinamide-GDP ribazoletransferase